jgi:hypothetical protein
LLQITHAARPQLIVETGPTPYIAKIRSALMKVVSFLAAAVVLAGIAGAQTPPPNNTEDASSAAKRAPESMQSNAPSGTVSPSAADANQASMQSTSESCHKQASDKKLTGDDRANFLKTCKMAKTTRTGS